MNLSLDFLLEQPRRVRIRGDRAEFLLSVIKRKNVVFCAAYGVLSGRPDQNNHFLIPAENNLNFFENLELAADPIRGSRNFTEYND